MTRRPTAVQGNCAAVPDLSFSPAMQSLLGALIQAIDTRTTTLAGAQEEAHNPATCKACGGSGYILIPRNPDEETGGGYVQVRRPPMSPPSGRARRETSPNTVERRQAARRESPDLSPASNLLGINIEAAPNANADKGHASASAAPSRLFGAALDPSATLPPATAASSATVSHPITVASTTTVLPHVNAAPTATPPNNIHSTATAHTFNPSALSYSPPRKVHSSTTPPSSPPSPPSVYLPGYSQVIPGYAALGPNTPVPSPPFAVFCVPGAERYYTITKGVRVGVFSGWQSVSPYVQGISGASYSKHKNIHAAYEAYVEAYNLNFVTYV